MKTEAPSMQQAEHDDWAAMMTRGQGGAPTAQAHAHNEGPPRDSGECGECARGEPCSVCANGAFEFSHPAHKAFEWGKAAVTGVSDDFWRASALAHVMDTAELPEDRTTQMFKDLLQVSLGASAVLDGGSADDGLLFDPLPPPQPNRERFKLIGSGPDKNVSRATPVNGCCCVAKGINVNITMKGQRGRLLEYVVEVKFKYEREKSKDGIARGPCPLEWWEYMSHSGQNEDGTPQIASDGAPLNEPSTWSEVMTVGPKKVKNPELGRSDREYYQQIMDDMCPVSNEWPKTDKPALYRSWWLYQFFRLQSTCPDAKPKAASTWLSGKVEVGSYPPSSGPAMDDPQAGSVDDKSVPPNPGPPPTFWKKDGNSYKARSSRFAAKGETE